MANLTPPFTLATAQQKVKRAQSLWNTRDPTLVTAAYTPSCIWRNRDSFLRGHAEITGFLTGKWARERDYVLRKEIFAFTEDRIAVQFWYEYWDAEESGEGAEEDEARRVWKRCYGLEDWTFEKDGRMRKRMMSGNDVRITEAERWFKGGAEGVNEVEIGEEHW